MSLLFCYTTTSSPWGHFHWTAIDLLVSVQPDSALLSHSQHRSSHQLHAGPWQQQNHRHQNAAALISAQELWRGSRSFAFRAGWCQQWPPVPVGWSRSAVLKGNVGVDLAISLGLIRAYCCSSSYGKICGVGVSTGHATPCLLRSGWRCWSYRHVNQTSQHSRELSQHHFPWESEGDVLLIS